MVLSQCVPLLLEPGHTTTVTLGIDGLDLTTELANNQESGVEHNQHALVSNKNTNMEFIQVHVTSYDFLVTYGRFSKTTHDVEYCIIQENVANYTIQTTDVPL